MPVPPRTPHGAAIPLALGVTVALVAALIWAITRSSAAPSTQDRSSRVTVRSSPTPSSSTATRAATPTSRRPAAQPSSAARRHLAALITSSGAERVSVAAYAVATGAQVDGGAGQGMRTASLAKLQLLETLLLQHQRAGTSLSESETDTVTRMIENSDNDAANATFDSIGGREEVIDLEPALGLLPTKTVPGGGNYWGLTRTSAPQQLQLLKNLAFTTSPLSAANRAFAFGLMQHVEDDQRWGVPVVADRGTVVAVKNGWLAVQDDDYDEDEDEGSWAVNSAGIVLVHGQRLLIVVMTQHDAAFQPGISLVQLLSKAAAAAVQG